MQSETLQSPPALKYDPRSALAAALCLLSLFFNLLGWVMAITGVVLLRRAVFQPKVKWILAAVALAPRILFLGAQSLAASPDLSFTIEPRTLATSFTLWSWSILIAAFGGYLLFARLPSRRAPDAPVEPASYGPALLKVGGVLLIGVAIALLLGVIDDFQRIQDAGSGRWALQHAVRGTVATFAPDELASLEGIGSHSRGPENYSVRVKLIDGRTFSASTTSKVAFEDLRRFAATAGLKPGTVRLRAWYMADWSNGSSGFTLDDCLGTYEYLDERAGERSTFEFWLENGRIAGKETTFDAQGRHVQMLRGIKISDTGEMEFGESPYAGPRESGPSTTSFSLRWSSQAQTGRFTRDGLQVGVKKYRKHLPDGVSG